MARNQNRVGRLDYIKINDRLREVIIRQDEHTCVYKEGFSDDRVARELQLPLVAVANMRRDAYGNLPTGGNLGGGQLRKDVEQLKLLVMNQAREMEELRVKYNKLISTLMLNEKMPVKHLEWKASTPMPPLPLSPQPH